MKIRGLFALAALALTVSVARAQDSTSTVPPTPPVTTSTPMPAPGTVTEAASAPIGSTWIGVQGGFGLPFGDFADIATSGVNFAATYDRMVYSNVAFGGEIGWHRFGGSDDLEKKETLANGAPADVTIRLLPLMANARLYLPTHSASAPFVTGGLGIVNVSTTIDLGTSKHSSSETRFALQLGGGADLKTTSQVRLGFGALYHYIGTSGSASSLFTIDGHLRFGLAK